MSSIKIILLIIEALLLVDGLWAIVFGKLPVGLFNFLFGLGEYKFPENQTRLFGLLLASPLLITYILSLILTSLLGAKGAGYAIVFGIIYILIITAASTIIVRNAKDSKPKKKR